MFTVDESRRPAVRRTPGAPAEDRSIEPALEERGAGNVPGLPGEGQGIPPARPEPLGTLTSAGLYDEVRRRLALRGYRWD
jgi:hypothetical protein